MRLKILSLAAAAAASVGAVAACQTYDFEPVEPLALARTSQVKKVVARKSKPNLMLVVDKSGSMAIKDDPASPSRITELQKAMVGTSGNGFLTNAASATVGRMGLAVFPDATETSPCIAGKVVYGVVAPPEGSAPADEEAAMSAASGQIATFIQGMSEAATTPQDQRVRGGTPTADTLLKIGAEKSLSSPDRDDFIVLLTDGLPNCNKSLNKNTCICVDGTSPCGSELNCLDQDRTVSQISTLTSAGIRTIVVGFGADTAGSLAAPTLNAMAEAGQMARTCKKPDGTRDPSLCGADSCDVATDLCATRFYKAKNAGELTTALQQITLLVGAGDPCAYALDSVPSKPELLEVTLASGKTDGQGNVTWDQPVVQKSGTDFTYAAGKVTFIGSTCDRILGATPTSPVNVEFGIIQSL